MTTEKTEAPPEAVTAEIREVVARAKAGDKSAVPRLRQLLDFYPAIWKSYGDLAAQASASWAALASGGDLHMRECLARYSADLSAGLTRPNASPVERLLADRVAACWLQLQYFTGAEAQAISSGEQPKLLAYRSKRQAEAQKMYESSLASLVAVQKLLPAEPAVVKPKESEAADAAPKVAFRNRIKPYLEADRDKYADEEVVSAGASN